MAYRIAVCDDELSAVSQIDIYLHQIMLETGLTFQVFYYASGEELLSDMPSDIQVLLLDIKLTDLSGIETARRLRARGLDFWLFFITSNVQYALEGYEVHAYAFLQKPLRYAPLKMYLLEVIDRINQSRPFTITLRDGSSSEIIDCAGILYLEVYGHSVSVVFSDHRKEFTVPLGEIEEQLKNHGFFRCHKSYLVNLRKVKSIRPTELVMLNGDAVPLSRHRRQDFLAAFQAVMGEF